jgi:hypothetical protein
MALIPESITGAINFGSIGFSLMYWIKWGAITTVMMAVMGAVFYYLQYPIKAIVFPLYGSGRDNNFSVQKSKWNRLRWNKQRTAWKPMLPLFNKKEIEPFDQEFQYPGRVVYAFELNDTWIPGRCNVDVISSGETKDGQPISDKEKEQIEAEIQRYLKKTKRFKLIPGKISINKTEDKIRAEINSVPYSVRAWQSLQHKRNAIEYAEHDFWNDNKTLIIAFMCALAIIGAGLIFVYLTYKMAGPSSLDMNNLAEAIRGMGNIPGNAPR